MSVIPQWVENDDPRPQLVIPAHDKPISNVAYLPDGQRVVTGSDDGTVRVWNLEYGEEEGMPLEHENTISSLAVTRDGTKIISSDVNGKIKVWDVKSCELVKQWSHPETSPTIAISPDDRLIAVGEETVVIYTVKGRRVHHSISVGGFVLSKCFSTDGSRLACGTDEDIRVYDVKRGILILGPLRGHEHSVNSVLWSHDGSRLFSASKDKTIRCWNPDTGKPIGQPLTGHERDICSLSLSSDGSILASASSDKTVRFWDVNSARPIGQHLQHDDKVIATCFSPSGKSVVSAGGKGSIYLWPVPQLDSIGTRTTLADLRTRVSISDFSPPPYSTHIPASGKVSDLDLGIFLPDAEPISAPPHPITPLILPPLFSTSLMVKQQDKKTTTISYVISLHCSTIV
ncbi:WD40 repeat-like protein [Imleria badia]|nr:WD40 repeat-like protein [Imleria badia]